jgi:hypothetical protein
VPGLWYVDEESQGEHPRHVALSLFINPTAAHAVSSYADLCFDGTAFSISLNRDVRVEMGPTGASRGRGGSDPSPARDANRG